MSKKKVLIIDDDKLILDLVENTLQEEYDVISVLDGREGINIAKTQKPDIILLDIMMPELDGFMTSNILNSIPETRDIPIIFLSAKKTTKGYRIAHKSGAIGYIMKPFHPDDLLDYLSKIFK